MGIQKAAKKAFLWGTLFCFMHLKYEMQQKGESLQFHDFLANDFVE